MTIVTWVNLKACKLTKENLYYISNTIPAHFESLVELLDDASKEGVTYYIVAWRDLDDGLPRWICHTEEDLCEQYHLTHPSSKMDNIFYKI